MKQILIAVLLIAAAGAVYYFVIKDKNKSPQSIIGEWKIEKPDSTEKRSSMFSFPDSIGIQTVFNDSIMKIKSGDSLISLYSYERKKNDLVLKQDSVELKFKIIKLDSANLQLSGPNKEVTSFHRL